ncbi:MAG: prepilin-type N-terminal cleavage/methylation domain-containing protein [Patescibacteria group bacterium]
MAKQKYFKKGFSLIEMIIYAAILSVLTIVTINATFSTIRSFAEFRVARDLNSSAASLLERMTREIRAARGINAAQSSLGVNPGRLTLLTKDSGGADTTVEFYVENGALKIKEGGVAMGALTSSSTEVTNFVVRSLSNPKSSAVKAELGLNATRGGISKSGNFYNTILLRGGY